LLSCQQTMTRRALRDCTLVPRAFRRYISRLLRVVVFWLDDASHAPSTHIIGLQFSWSTSWSTSATTVCEPDYRPK
jgi:hypothetical protein